MVPKIVTRLANIAAKMAGSGKYDSTVEPVTAFEYYLDKAADKILDIRGLPSRPVTDETLILVSTPEGEIWEEPSVAKAFTLQCQPPENIPKTRPMTDAEKQLFEEVFDCLSNDVAFNLFFNPIGPDDVPLPLKHQMVIKAFNRSGKTFDAVEESIMKELGSGYKLRINTFKFNKFEGEENNITYKITISSQSFSLAEI